MERDAVENSSFLLDDEDDPMPIAEVKPKPEVQVEAIVQKDAAGNASFLLEDDDDPMPIAQTASQEEVEQVEVIEEAVIVEPIITHPQVEFDELESYHFSPGKLYWQKSDGNSVLLRNSGDFLDHNYLAKFKKNNIKLSLEQATNSAQIKKGTQLFHNHSEASGGKLKAQAREMLLNWVKTEYWDDNEEAKLLDLTQITCLSFYNFTNKQEEYLADLSLDMFRRSCLTANAMVIFALALGYNDFKFLQDIYHLSFLYDLGFNRESLTLNIWESLEEARANGISFEQVNKELSDAEKEALKKHCVKSYEIALAEFSSLLHNPKLLSLIKYHHEYMNGNGFPLGANQNELSDLENLVIFTQSLFPYDNFEYGAGDGNGFLKNILSNGATKENFLSSRLKKLITNVFDSTKTEDMDMGA